METIRTPARWRRLLTGFVMVFAVFQGLASSLGSTRGEYGLIVAAVVVAMTLGVELGVFEAGLGDAIRGLGLGVPQPRGIVAAAIVGSLVVLAPLAVASVSGMRLSPLPDWPVLAAGIFAQAGVAEETLFRGYLFGHLREGRSFWRAASVSMLPFVLVHLWLFATMPWTIAMASVLLAVIISFPLAHLFELGGGTIWAPAIVHFAVQAIAKLVVVEGADSAALYPLAVMVSSALLPLAAFLFKRRRQTDEQVSAMRDVL